MPKLGGTSLSQHFVAIAGSTGQAFSVASLDIGNADTTISRSSAGVIAEESLYLQYLQVAIQSQIKEINQEYYPSLHIQPILVHH